MKSNVEKWLDYRPTMQALRFEPEISLGLESFQLAVLIFRVQVRPGVECAKIA